MQTQIGAGGKTSTLILTLAVFILKFDQIPLTTPPPDKIRLRKYSTLLYFLGKMK